MKNIYVLALATIAMSACTTTPHDVEITEVSPDALPSAVRQAIAAERADFQVEEVLKKTRDGRVYYDVEGKIADGSELEFDILMKGDVAHIVEVQRDLTWPDVPAEVRAVALEASGNFEPVRIIESVQTDGSVIYELFKHGQPDDPAYEVRVHAGKVELLQERWEH